MEAHRPRRVDPASGYSDPALGEGPDQAWRAAGLPVEPA